MLVLPVVAELHVHAGIAFIRKVARPPTTAHGTAHVDVCVGLRGRATAGRHVPR